MVTMSFLTNLDMARRLEPSPEPMDDSFMPKCNTQGYIGLAS